MLDDYLARIGLTHRPAPGAEGLAQVQLAHRLAIGFENVDVMLGRPIAIDLAAVWTKLGGRRGGYCFEHNALFGAMLGALGLANRPLLARVWMGVDLPGGSWPGDPAAHPPRTHTLRLVEVNGAPWIADAGFGGSWVPPMPLVGGTQVDTPDGASHRLTEVGPRGSSAGTWLLERRGPSSATDGRALGGAEWEAQYSFDLAAVAPIDLVLSNWWTSTRPGTRFTTACRASVVLPDGFAALNDRRLAMHSRGRGTVIELQTAADWRTAMSDLFHVELTRDEVDRLALF